MSNAWGFTSMSIASIGGSLDLQDVVGRLNEGARSRGIDPGKESDALDQSRDLIISEAIGYPYEFEIVDEELIVWDSRYGKPVMA